MWTQWYIYYANMHHLFTMYANLPGGMALTMHWREPGEHFSEADAAAYRAAPEKLATTWPQVPAMPNPVIAREETSNVPATRLGSFVHPFIFFFFVSPAFSGLGRKVPRYDWSMIAMEPVKAPVR
jgi:hypothetical protein